MTFPTLDVEREILGGAGLIIGIDEVGRGAIAGPVAVGAFAVLVDESCECPPGLRDSKLLTERRRIAVHEALQAWGVARAVGLASPSEIDEHGIIPALTAAALRALWALAESGVDIRAATVLLDGKHDWLSGSASVGRVVARVKADRDCASVAAASVIAKVHRDELMLRLASEHPHYGWDGNKGYGSAAHLAAIAAAGPSDHHRRTWLH